VQGRRFGGRVVDANIVIIGDVGPNVRTWERRILSTAVRPKKEKKGLLDKYLINGPPITT
jgi:hypothetical protein